MLSWRPVVVLTLTLVLLTDLRPVVLGAVQRGWPATSLWNAAPPVAPSAALPVVPTGGAAYPHNVPLFTLAGQSVNLSELKGKVVFVNLWASWCGPCLAGRSGIQALYGQADPQNVAFVMVSPNENPARQPGHSAPPQLLPVGSPRREQDPNADLRACCDSGFVQLHKELALTAFLPARVPDKS